MLDFHRIGVLAALLGSGVLAEPPAAPAPAADEKPAAKAPADEPAAPPKRPAAAAKALEGVKTIRDIEFAKPDDKPVRLDLFLPEDAKAPTPLIIWIHGGGWLAGSKSGCPALPFVKDGFAVASVDYRLTNRAVFPAQIHDCKAAVRFLRAHAKEYNLDPARFGAWGASAGGHLVALLGTTCGNTECEGAELGNAECSSGVQCVCDWFGPTDFPGYKSESADTAPMLIALFGGKMSDKMDLAKLASPALHVKKDAVTKYPPFLIVQGNKDPLVPWEQSKELSDKLKEAGVEQELVIVEGQGHGFMGESRTTEVKRVHDFFTAKLKPAATSAADSKGPATSPAKPETKP